MVVLTLCEVFPVAREAGCDQGLQEQPQESVVWVGFTYL